MALLEVNDLKTYFHTRDGVVKAVDGISYELNAGETLGIVGESGSGKSVSCYSLLKLIPCPPGKIEGGTAMFDGVDLLSASPDVMKGIRGKRISMIFQDPMTCLNPYLRVGDQVMEPLLIHDNLTYEEAKKRAIQGLVEVGIQDAESRFNQFPHEFSGGMRQRVMIAMALITKPEILIADEPTTALDVTVQAQILELIKRLQREHGTAVIFVTHDLGVIANVASQIIVMYAGKVAEKGTPDEIFYQPKHPYTQALLDSIPSTHKKGEELYTIPGMPPDLSKNLQGCSFSPRCTKVIDRCKVDSPVLVPLTPSHLSSCLRVNELGAS